MLGTVTVQIGHGRLLHRYAVVAGGVGGQVDGVHTDAVSTSSWSSKSGWFVSERLSRIAFWRAMYGAIGTMVSGLSTPDGLSWKSMV